MTTALEHAERAARFRARAHELRESAARARADGDTQAAADYDAAAVDWDADAEMLELAAPAIADAAKPKRMTMGRVVEQLLESRGRGGAKSAAVTIGRSARGIVTWEITATADPDELEQLDDALAAAIAAHDRLAGDYPMPEGE